MKSINQKKGQVAIETIMLVAVILILLLPALYLFFNFVNTSTQQIVDAQVKQIGDSIINNAETLYYYGKNSSIVLEFEFSDKLNQIKIPVVVDDSPGPYEIVFVINEFNDNSIAQSERVYLSKVQIVEQYQKEAGKTIYPEIELNQKPMEGRRTIRLTNIDGKRIFIERLT